MTPQYLQTRSDTTTVLKVSGLTSTDSVLASARSASGDVTAATVTSATVDDAVVFTASLPVLSTGRYELDVVSIASDGACSQLVLAILQVREGIASVSSAATTYEVTAATEVASVEVTLTAGTSGDSTSYQVAEDLSSHEADAVAHLSDAEHVALTALLNSEGESSSTLTQSFGAYGEADFNGASIDPGSVVEIETSPTQSLDLNMSSSGVAWVTLVCWSDCPSSIISNTATAGLPDVLATGVHCLQLYKGACALTSSTTVIYIGGV